MKISLLLLLGVAGCAGTLEHDTRAGYDAAAARFPGPSTVDDEAPAPVLDGSLAAYVAHAMHESPELRAAFARWRAGVRRISVARRLPEPTVSFAAYVRAVETRVGPQRARVGVRQMVPWPAAQRASADAAASRAQVHEANVEVSALALRSRVAAAYWRLWLVHRVHVLSREQELVLAGLSDLVRGRIELGQASLADATQADLSLARHRDHHQAHAEAAGRVEAELRAAVAAEVGTEMPVDDALPSISLPAEEESVLLAAAVAHPRLERFERLAAASEADAAREQSRRYPNLGFGFDWIATGRASNAGVPDSGKDPLILSVSLTVPLWGSSYGAAEEAALADASAHRADREAFEDQVAAELTAAVVAVRDSYRRALLHEHTLVPQAQTSLEAVIDSYQVGRVPLAAAIIAQRDLLSLLIALDQARAQHAVAWARLEHIVGREIARREETSP